MVPVEILLKRILHHLLSGGSTVVRPVISGAGGKLAGHDDGIRVNILGFVTLIPN